MTSPSSALDALNQRLASVGLAAEVLLVGGAIMSLAFRAEPGSRRARDLFAPPSLLTDVVQRVASDVGLPSDWLDGTVREAVGTDGMSGGGWEGSHLQVYAPRPEYALAMKCAQLGAAPATDLGTIEADLRYLLRLTGTTSASAALHAVHTYFTPRQLVEDLEARISVLLS